MEYKFVRTTNSDPENLHGMYVSWRGWVKRIQEHANYARFFEIQIFSRFLFLLIFYFYFQFPNNKHLNFDVRQQISCDLFNEKFLGKRNCLRFVSFFIFLFLYLFDLFKEWDFFCSLSSVFRENNWRIGSRWIRWKSFFGRGQWIFTTNTQNFCIFFCANI